MSLRGGEGAEYEHGGDVADDFLTEVIESAPPVDISPAEAEVFHAAYEEALIVDVALLNGWDGKDEAPIDTAEAAPPPVAASASVQADRRSINPLLSERVGSPGKSGHQGGLVHAVTADEADAVDRFGEQPRRVGHRGRSPATRDPHCINPYASTVIPRSGVRVPVA
jgi:hypothetical protein